MQYDANWDAYDIAKDIYNNYKLHQSCSVVGIGEDIIPMGEKVLDGLRRLDTLENTYVGSDKRNRRKRVILPNTVGGYVAQKIFKWKQEIRNKKMIYTIWRVQ